MSVHGGPKIVSSNLVLCLDAINTKNFNAGNMLPYSQGAFNSWATDVFGSTSWPNFTITNDYAAAPDGSNTASRIQLTGMLAGNSKYLAKSGLFTSLTGTFTLAFYAKSNTGSNQSASMAIVPYSGTVTGTTDQTITLTTSWQQFSMTFNVTVAGNIYVEMIGFVGSADFDILLWGAQLTQTNFVASYVSTSASAVSFTKWVDYSGSNLTVTKGGSQSPTYPSWNSSGYFEFTGGVTANNYSRFEVTTPTMNALTVIAYHYATASGGHLLRHTTNSFQIGPDGYTAGASYNDVACSKLDTLNTWICDALTFDGTVLKGYRNGAQYSNVTRSSSTTIAGGTLNIGTRSDSYASHYVGRIAMIAIYSQALSAAEIQQNFNALRGRFGL